MAVFDGREMGQARRGEEGEGGWDVTSLVAPIGHPSMERRANRQRENALFLPSFFPPSRSSESLRFQEAILPLYYSSIQVGEPFCTSIPTLRANPIPFPVVCLNRFRSKLRFKMRWHPTNQPLRHYVHRNRHSQTLVLLESVPSFNLCLVALRNLLLRLIWRKLLSFCRHVLDRLLSICIRRIQITDLRIRLSGIRLISRDAAVLTFVIHSIW